MSKTLRNLRAAALALTLATGGASLACDNDGPMENAGERMDEAAEEAGDAVEDAADEVEDRMD